MEPTGVTDEDLAVLEQVCREAAPADWRDSLHNCFIRDVPVLVAEIRRLRDFESGELIPSVTAWMLAEAALGADYIAKWRNGHG